MIVIIEKRGLSEGGRTLWKETGEGQDLAKDLMWKPYFLVFVSGAKEIDIKCRKGATFYS